MDNEQIWRSGTTIVQAIFDNWSRDIPPMQTQQELYAHFGVALPLEILRELNRLYNIEMDVDTRSRG